SAPSARRPPSRPPSSVPSSALRPPSSALRPPSSLLRPPSVGVFHPRRCCFQTSAYRPSTRRERRMASILEEQLGVASGAAYWDAGAYRIWQSTVPDILCYAPRDLRLATETGGRFRASLNQVQRWRSGSLEVTGGSAVLGVFPDPDGEAIGPLADQ